MPVRVGLHATDDDWFLHVNVWDPHTPYRTPLDYGNPFEGQPIDPWLSEGRQEGREWLVWGNCAWSCQRSVRWRDWLLLRTHPRHAGQVLRAVARDRAGPPRRGPARPPLSVDDLTPAGGVSFPTGLSEAPPWVEPRAPR